VYLQAAVDERRARGHEVLEEDLAHIYLVHFGHTNIHSKLHFPVLDDTAPQRRRPLRDSDAAEVPQIVEAPKRGRGHPQRSAPVVASQKNGLPGATGEAEQTVRIEQ